MDTLPDLVPDGVELDTLQIVNATTVTMTGSGRTQEAINLFVTELSNSGLANNPQVNLTPPNDGQTYFGFTLSAVIIRED